MLPLEKRAEEIKATEVPKFERALADAQTKHEAATRKATDVRPS